MHGLVDLANLRIYKNYIIMWNRKNFHNSIINHITSTRAMATETTRKAMHDPKKFNNKKIPLLLLFVSDDNPMKESIAKGALEDPLRQNQVNSRAETAGCWYNNKIITIMVCLAMKKRMVTIIEQIFHLQFVPVVVYVKQTTPKIYDWP